jgi:hypothetical protein
VINDLSTRVEVHYFTMTIVRSGLGVDSSWTRKQGRSETEVWPRRGQDVIQLSCSWSVYCLECREGNHYFTSLKGRLLTEPRMQHSFSEVYDLVMTWCLPSDVTFFIFSCFVR